jgi:transcriptional regulator with XRE-family HTH domain
LDTSSRVTVGPAGLVLVMKPGQILTACAARGLSLEQLRTAAGISRPTMQAALRGRRVRPTTARKLAQALARLPAPEGMAELLEAG